MGFRADLQQPGRLLQRANPPPRKYQGCQRIENPGFPSPGPMGSISSMEKRHAPFYTEETESPLFLSPFHPVMQEDRAHLRHPNSWGVMDRVAAGPTGTKHPNGPPGVDQTSGPTPKQTRGRADTVWCSASLAELVTTRAAARQQLRRLRRGDRMQVHQM